MEILLFITGYTLIFFERVTVKNKAKFQKISKIVRYIKEVEDPKERYEAIDYRKETNTSDPSRNISTQSMNVSRNVITTVILEDYVKRPVSIN